MKQMIIHGGKPLKGDVWIGGAKNSTVALIPASILSRTPVTLEAVPRIADVDNLMDLLTEMDVKCNFHETTLEINPDKIKMSPLPAGKIKSLRASYYFMGALLGRFGKAVVGFPGGDDIGPRPIDQHIKGFEALGATVKNENDQIIITAPADGLHGAKIHLKMPSVGATMNIIMASVTAQGQTIIENAAKEPEIVNLATFLNNMGAKITGAGTSTINIEGVSYLGKAFTEVIPDRIEAGTYIIAGALMGHDLKINNIIPAHVASLIEKLSEMGCDMIIDDNSVTISKINTGKSINVKTLGYPGFPTDLQQPLSTLLTQLNGTSILEETIYENRFQNVKYLVDMGASIIIENKKIYVTGPTDLVGKTVVATDLRAGACLVLAGLKAKGETIVENIEHVLRGYENIIGKLSNVGAEIELEEYN